MFSLGSLLWGHQLPHCRDTQAAPRRSHTRRNWGLGWWPAINTHTCGQAPWEQMPQPQLKPQPRTARSRGGDTKPEPLSWVASEFSTRRNHARYLLLVCCAVLRHKLRGWAALQQRKANTYNTPFIEQSTLPTNLRWHFFYTKFLYECGSSLDFPLCPTDLFHWSNLTIQGFKFGTGQFLPTIFH